MNFKPLDKIFGVMIQSNKIEATEIYRNIDPGWLLNKLHLKVYEAAGKLIEANEEINLLTITQHLLKAGELGNDASKISLLTMEVQHYDIMNVWHLFSSFDYEFKKRQATILCSTLSTSIGSGNWSVTDYTKVLEKGLEAMKVDVIKTESNLETVNQVMERHELAKDGNLPGVDLPYHTFRRIVLLEDVDLMVIGARPAMGKTAFVISTGVKMATQDNLKVAIFALEMSRVQMMRRVLANLAQVDSNRIKYGECTNYEKAKILSFQSVDEMDNLMLYEGSRTIAQIGMEVNRLKATTGVDIVFVDYLQKIQPENHREDLFTSVTKASNGLKSISQNQKVPIIAMAQLSRDSAKLGKRPSLPDLRQSGEIEQDASIVGFIHRPEYYGETQMEDGSDSSGMSEIIIAKNREGDVGVYPMKVNLKISKFMDLGADWISMPGKQTNTIDDNNPF